MNPLKVSLFVLLALFSVGANAEKVYMWVDDEGKKHFGDKRSIDPSKLDQVKVLKVHNPLIGSTDAKTQLKNMGFDDSKSASSNKQATTIGKQNKKAFPLKPVKKKRTSSY